MGLSGTSCKWRDLSVHGRGVVARKDHVHVDVGERFEVAGGAGSAGAVRDRQVARRASTWRGIALTGEGGLLPALVANVLQAGLNIELDDHLGYAPHAVEGRGSGNSRNGGYAKTVITEVGPVTVPKHARRLDGLAEQVISLFAKGMTTGDIHTHLFEIYGTESSRETISKITDAVVGEMTAWQNRPLDRVYPVMLIDAIVIKVRDARSRTGPSMWRSGSTWTASVLGMWPGPTGGEGAMQWMTMLTDLRNRGIADVLIVCCDGLKGLPDAIRRSTVSRRCHRAVLCSEPT